MKGEILENLISLFLSLVFASFAVYTLSYFFYGLFSNSISRELDTVFYFSGHPDFGVFVYSRDSGFTDIMFSNGSVKTVNTSTIKKIEYIHI
jgi:hypothetical protein